MELLSIASHIFLFFALLWYDGEAPLTFYAIDILGIVQTRALFYAYSSVSEGMYYHIFYGMSIAQGLLYLMCSIELHNTRLHTISVLMQFFVVMKVILFASIVLEMDSFRYEWSMLLRPINLIMVTLFAILLLDAKKGDLHVRSSRRASR